MDDYTVNLLKACVTIMWAKNFAQTGDDSLWMMMMKIICYSFENLSRDFKPAAHIIKSGASMKLKILSGLKLCIGWLFKFSVQ